MTTAESITGSGRYIIRSDDVQRLNQVAQAAAIDPSMSLVDAIGPAGQPHTLVIDMPHETAASLVRQFRDAQPRVIIEPDRPLSLFDGMQGETG
ncbi:hypothetical protein [Noviherbaspirillum galbum]|uniref:Uncharacterized protein n=1 Tax=Noviherbaspirillum galbum TaxID=2709383 RepID=A0A6B3SP38_9BURK|nr:hypothetical protein [Noviherbaspirillum galbum]NEX62503.1 hypothetical protein [Noviherbaspirillum galbum]